MDNQSIDPKIVEQVSKLQEKYEAMGQDLSSYLDGLLYSNYLTYWDYIHLDTLLSLQNPRTDFPDEEIFIMYHQITELYFKLIIHELKQISTQGDGITDSFFLKRIQRINRYFLHLCDSFEVMIDGMDKEQFLKYRMALLPASGFQSVQYRKIEVMSTDFIYLVDHAYKEELSQNTSIEKQFAHIYWQQGATELATGKQTLTLKMFMRKYRDDLIQLGKDMQACNLWRLYQEHLQDTPLQQEIVVALRSYDQLANINWPLSHYKSAVRYLHAEPKDIAATGGTNWQKYLPPRFQKRSFFPDLWSEEEKQEWGKAYVMEVIGKK
ncbi:tryptophan 2,3-dioxygenase family protein [Algivirga pacifica]|uniref:Tryptophan 2,3-dioxygenase family protein n=1 Tax=Algivirga pacifica TaxID=1162670 RepID=A0ABP9D748_9BACT